MSDITVITGSTLGNAEYIAEHLADILEKSSFNVEVLHGANLDQLPLQGVWLVVTSTYGAGDVPDNLHPLLEQLTEQDIDLHKVQFGAVGLGSSEYDSFCAGIKIMDDLLRSRGARKIGERLEIDVIQHEIPEDPAEIWLKHWIKLLTK